MEVGAEASTRSPLVGGNSTLPAGPDSKVALIFTLFYLIGTLGNLAALFYLYGSKSKPRNSKHAFMLRCLATSDLVAVVGMWIQLNAKHIVPGLAKSRGFCYVRTIWRIFGLGSGCVVIVMAVERWFALTRPFFYQKYVTLSMIRRSMFALWLTALIVVCLPFVGFGVYYEEKAGNSTHCLRYKQAKTPKDIAYAYLYMTFGALLCLCLVVCNVAVMKALVMSKQRMLQRKAVLVRRISRNRDLTLCSSTSEEAAFARIMALFCLGFVVCWVPQIISVPLAHMSPNSHFNKIFFTIADVLLATHFVADPYFYILQRWPVFKELCRKRNGSRVNSVKTSNELCSL